VANTASRVSDIARVARNEMYVELGDCLAGGCPVVESHVVARRLVQILNDRSGLGDQRKHLFLFVQGEIPPAIGCPVRHDECVAGVHRKSIPD